MDLYEASERFVEWLERRILYAGRGDSITESDVDPSGRLWLGRLAPESKVIELGLGERGERLDPCAIGIRLRPSTSPPWQFEVEIRACAWLRGVEKTWQKSNFVNLRIPISLTSDLPQEYRFGNEELVRALEDATGLLGLRSEIRVEVTQTSSKRVELTILLVNTSPGPKPPLHDTNLYESSLEVFGLKTEPYTIEALPDSFRYDRRVVAFGINCGIEHTDEGSLRTSDSTIVNRSRPTYWNVPESQPDLTFERLERDPLPSLESLLSALDNWGRNAWSKRSLDERATCGNWNPAMREEAQAAACEFEEEKNRIATGIELLKTNPNLRQAFCLMNTAIAHSARGRYDSWRPFQVGFLLATLRSIVEPEAESDITDIVWFATGGGKTETYLGLLVTAALYDRLSGKKAGLTAWTRFPLRMLSLQQTQRFADAMAGAELARRRAQIAGAPFSVGFLVGDDATPNSIPVDPEPGKPDPEDESMPSRYKVLLRCPFCHEESIRMEFNRTLWRLEHRCTNATCPWPEDALPFYIVDEEIFRFLPTVVVGTLDKAASIGLQAAMRGLVGSPLGRCPQPGHGYTYASRAKRPSGCLVPGCQAKAQALEMPENLFGPSFRLQDELHLLKDSLGAVDAHYETLLDHLEVRICGRRPKILASSATLAGYEKQVDTLYKRRARVFPVQGPSASEGFWTSESDRLLRKFVSIAPRGVTLEFAVDRITTELQTAVRLFLTKPGEVCADAGIDPSFASDLLSLYGVDVIYGNTLRDLDAVVRSLETQIRVEGSLNVESLTGKTTFERVRQTLEALDRPTTDFDARLHVITASSMISHGVDVDRLNVMLMLGVPLTTAEFIQATARVGRRWPGLVFVLHKIARERDASAYRFFEKFVEQGDRFVEPIPITRHSRRVLERTIAGIELARIYALHEPRSKRRLSTIIELRKFFYETGLSAGQELQDLAEALALTDPLDDLLREDLKSWIESFFRRLQSPPGNIRFLSELCPNSGPMISLRDVEEQVPIFGMVTK